MKALEAIQAKVRNAYPNRFAVPVTVRLLLDDEGPRQGSGPGRCIGLVSDMASAFAHQTATYTPASPGKTLCLDLGLSTLLVTDGGELHGRGWLTRITALDRRIQAIARNRQRLGLSLDSGRRCRAAIQPLRGGLKTELNRILNRLVTRRKPAGWCGKPWTFAVRGCLVDLTGCWRTSAKAS